MPTGCMPKGRGFVQERNFNIALHKPFQNQAVVGRAPRFSTTTITVCFYLVVISMVPC